MVVTHVLSHIFSPSLGAEFGLLNSIRQLSLWPCGHHRISNATCVYLEGHVPSMSEHFCPQLLAEVVGGSMKPYRLLIERFLLLFWVDYFFMHVLVLDLDSG